MSDEEIATDDELQYLRPPPHPSTSTYRGFGSIWNTYERLISLEEAGVEQVYKDVGEHYENLVPELKRLLRLALVSFISLVGVPSINPQQFPASVERLRVIFINMHHLLNMYRPHQSREMLVTLMREQTAAKWKEVEMFRETYAGIEQRLSELERCLPQSEAGRTKRPVKAWDLDVELDIDKRNPLAESDGEDAVVLE